MNTTPRVSIVLPTYNGHRYIHASILSVLEQDYRDLELIIVDDASTDETPRIIHDFAQRDTRVRFVHNERNRKLPASLNIGFAAARGEYLTWTSDDNLYRPKAIGAMVSSLDANPDFGFVYSNMSVIDEYGELVGPAEWVKPPVHLGEGCCIGACFLYRRTLMERVGAYDEAVTLAEDYDFWLRASRHTALLHSWEDLYLYRTHGGSLTSTQSERCMMAHLRCQLKNLPTLSWLTRCDRARLLVYAAWIASNRGERSLARDCLRSALGIHPGTVLLGRLKVTLGAVLPRSLINLIKQSPLHRPRTFNEDSV